jgi:hypothetical protein
MADDGVISHAEALALIDVQIDARIYVGRPVPIADPRDPGGPTRFVHRLATLKNPRAPEPPRLDPDVGFYDHGGETLCLPPMAGTIQLRDYGIDFRVAEKLLLRVAWRGSEEVGDDGPDRELLTRLRAPSAESEAGELDPELEQFFAGGTPGRDRNPRSRSD